jgi:hypothetical protein
MREKTMRRQLAALGCPPFEPTDEQRELVRVLAFNGVAHERIAEILEIRMLELVYFFRRELSLAEDYVLAHATKAIFDLARQRNDLGVAYKANELMLRTRSPKWREPKAVEAEEGKPVERMNLIEVDRAIAELERRRREHAAAPDAEAPAPDIEDVAG